MIRADARSVVRDRHEPYVTWRRYGKQVECSCGKVWRGDGAQVAWAVHVGRVAAGHESTHGAGGARPVASAP